MPTPDQPFDNDIERLRQRRQCAKVFLNHHHIDPDDLQTKFWRERFKDAYPEFFIERGSLNA